MVGLAIVPSIGVSSSATSSFLGVSQQSSGGRYSMKAQCGVVSAICAVAEIEKPVFQQWGTIQRDLVDRGDLDCDIDHVVARPSETCNRHPA